MFKLADSRGSTEGLYCGRDGLFLGPCALIEHREGAYRVRPQEEVAVLLTAAYELVPDLDLEDCLARLPQIAEALEKGDLARAMIAGLHLRLGKISEDRVARLAGAEELLKYRFNPNQPPDWHGRWSTEGGGSSRSQAGTADHPALMPVQELLPFGARPPLFFNEPPKTFRPFREPIPRLSGKGRKADPELGTRQPPLCRREWARFRGALDGPTIRARQLEQNRPRI